MSHAARLPWLAVLVTIVLQAIPVAAAQAAPSPRVVVEVDGMSVVLVAAEQRIHAYVDRIADNAPVEDATLGLELRGSGTRLALRQVSPGLFVAPFLPSRRDVFLVTLERAGNTQSQVVAELLRDEGPADLLTSAGEGTATSRTGQLAWLLMGLVALVVMLGNRYRPALRTWLPMGRHAG